MKQNNAWVLKNARVVLPDRVLSAASVLVKGSQIASISTTENTSLASAAIIDCEGITLFPGFIDVHIHGAIGVDTMDADAPDLHRISEFLASQGVTAWMPTIVPAKSEDYERSVTAIDERMKDESGERSAGARVIGVHYEGPFINTAQCGALRSQYFKSFSSVSDIESLPVPSLPSSVRMITVAPEIEGGISLIRELVGRGWVVSVGHTRASVETLDEAFAAGAHHLTHFMNAMPPFHHRSPGPVGWGLLRDAVTCDIIADGVHLDPFVLQLLFRAKSAGGLTLISDAIAATGKGDGEYEIWDETIIVKNGRTQNSRGTIAGSVITMLDAVRMMLSVGCTEVEVAAMASTNPARLLGLAKECGSIEEGKRADLVALDDQRRVHFTILGGHFLNVAE